MEDTATEKVEEEDATEATSTSEEQKSYDVTTEVLEAKEEIVVEEKAAEPEPKKEGGRAQKRISELITGRNKDALALSDKDKRITELEAQINDPKPEVKSDMPQLEDFEDHNDYQKSVYDWTRTQISEEKKVEDQKSEHQRQIDEVQKTAQPFWDKVDALEGEAKEEIVTAYDALIDPKTSTKPLNNDAQNYMIKSEIGPDLLIHLNRHLDVFDQINSMDVFELTRELDKLSSNITKSKVSKVVSSAPKPVTPIDAGGGGSMVKEPDDMSEAEWLDWREKTKKVR